MVEKSLAPFPSCPRYRLLFVDRVIELDLLLPTPSENAYPLQQLIQLKPLFEQIFEGDTTVKVFDDPKDYLDGHPHLQLRMKWFDYPDMVSLERKAQLMHLLVQLLVSSGGNSEHIQHLLPALLGQNSSAPTIGSPAAGAATESVCSVQLSDSVPGMVIGTSTTSAALNEEHSYAGASSSSSSRTSSRLNMPDVQEVGGGTEPMRIRVIENPCSELSGEAIQYNYSLQFKADNPRRSENGHVVQSHCTQLNGTDMSAKDAPSVSGDDQPIESDHRQWEDVTMDIDNGDGQPLRELVMPETSSDMDQSQIEVQEETVDSNPGVQETAPVIPIVGELGHDFCGHPVRHQTGGVPTSCTDDGDRIANESEDNQRSEDNDYDDEMDNTEQCGEAEGESADMQEGAQDDDIEGGDGDDNGDSPDDESSTGPIEQNGEDEDGDAGTGTVAQESDGDSAESTPPPKKRRMFTFLANGRWSDDDDDKDSVAGPSRLATARARTAQGNKSRSRSPTSDTDSATFVANNLNRMKVNAVPIKQVTRPAKQLKKTGPRPATVDNFTDDSSNDCVVLD